MKYISDDEWAAWQHEKEVRKWRVPCDACGTETKIATTSFVALLKDEEIVRARVCWRCCERAMLIPTLDPYRPPYEPETVAPMGEDRRWRWLYINPDLIKE